MRTPYALIVAVVIAGGLWLRWPALHSGFLVDDYVQLAMMRGFYPVPRAPLSLFTFTDGSVFENAALREAGFLPWWSHPELRVAMFRPLSSALMWCDLALFGDRAFAYHLHSALWWIAALLAFAAVLRRVLPVNAALLAFVLVVAHPVHAVLLGWIANRNALVATSFALLGLWLQLRARDGGVPRWGGRPAWLACFAVALAAGEYALAFIGYGVLLDWQDRPAARSASRMREIGRVLGPWLGLVGAYAALRAVLGYGARGSAMYVDPLREPLAFAVAACERLPLLAGELVFALRASWFREGLPWTAALAHGGVPAWLLTPASLHGFQLGLGVLALGLFVWIARAAVRARASARFATWGCFFALAPVLGTTPESRVLLPALLGFSIVLAAVLHAQLSRSRSTEARGVGTAARALFVCTAAAWWLGAVVAPVVAAGEPAALARFGSSVRSALLAPELDTQLAGRRVLLTSVLEPTTALLPFVRRWHGRPAPSRCHLLLSAFAHLRLTRLSANSFRLERIEATTSVLDDFARQFNREPLHAGQRFAAGGMQVSVERALAGRPLQVRYALDRSLDDPTIVLLLPTLAGLRPLPFPAIGVSVILDPPLQGR